jgi:hypothetical protein
MNSKKTNRQSPRPVPGPKPEVLKLHGNWQVAIRKSLKKRKPSGGWPK